MKLSVRLSTNAQDRRETKSAAVVIGDGKLVGVRLGWSETKENRQQLWDHLLFIFCHDDLIFSRCRSTRLIKLNRLNVSTSQSVFHHHEKQKKKKKKKQHFLFSNGRRLRDQVARAFLPFFFFLKRLLRREEENGSRWRPLHIHKLKLKLYLMPPSAACLFFFFFLGLTNFLLCRTERRGSSRRV